MPDTVQVLKEARALIADPERWTQRNSVVDARGDVVPLMASYAERFCARGAVWRVCGGIGAEPQEVYDALRGAMGMVPSVFNDTHTHPEVLAAFDQAISSEEAKGA